MKVKVNIYSQKSVGSPLRVLVEPIYGEVTRYEELGSLISSILDNASPFIPDQELIAKVHGYSFGRWFDIVNLQAYLRDKGLVLIVSEVTSETPQIDFNQYYIEVVSPVMGMLPVSTTFYSEKGEYDILDIIGRIIDKFNVGDLSLTPENDFMDMYRSFSEMKSKGMPIFPMYIDQLVNELYGYGFQLYYVYNS